MNFKDIFSLVVDEVRKEYDPTKGLQPYFQFGLYSDLIESLNIKDNNQIEKYPLIWLVWESANNQQQWIDPYIYTISPRVFICDLAVQDDNTDERYTHNFDTVIDPLFELLIKELMYAPNVEFPTAYNFLTNDIPDGKLDSGSGIPDFVSAKEINLKNLIIYKNC